MSLTDVSFQAFGNNMFNIPLLVTRPEIKAVAERLTKKTGSTVTPAQVLLAWSEIGGHSVIPKSVSPSRIIENFKEVELSSEDIKEIEAVGKVQKRYNIPYTASKLIP